MIKKTPYINYILAFILVNMLYTQHSNKIAKPEQTLT